MAKDFRFENFKSVYEFEKAIRTRPLNEAFKGEEAGKNRGDSDWYQTENFDEANDFLLKGWNKKIDEIRTVLEKFSSKVVVERRKLRSDIVGFMPNVPSAIKGFPQSMYRYTKVNKVESQRVLHLILNTCSTGGTSGETLMKAGLTVLKLAMILDKSNVRTKIDVVPKMSYNGSNKCYGCTVTIKDYRQSFNYAKMAYPIANPSFFRRHGFAWLEHLDGDLRDWGCYGQSIHRRSKSEQKEYLEWAGLLGDGTVYIDLDDCKEAGFDPVKLMENKGIK